MRRKLYLYTILLFLLTSCKKNDSNPSPGSATFNINSFQIDGKTSGFTFTNVNINPVIKIKFSSPVKEDNINTFFTLKDNALNSLAINFSFENNDSVVIIKPISNLNYLSKYSFYILPTLQSTSNIALGNSTNASLITALDLTDKFPQLSDSLLLDLVQRQTFKYFWDFGHPVSGLARERNSSGDIVTTGGSGFGVMSILVGIKRNFISRAEGLTRITQIVNFLKNNVQTYHGAFPHWLNGSTGATIPFSPKDDGADLVETSFMMQGLLTARQYFNLSDPNEIALTNTINQLWNKVEWSWFQKNNENVLYWHWSPNYNWDMNFQITGWDEALITYVLAASSPTYSIPKMVYDNGWTRNGSFINNKSFYNIKLPLGPDNGGPLFFAHYSFLGLNPHTISDSYASYWNQNVAHAQINYNYCVANPKNYNGYSSQCWGLTASDDNVSGYSAHEPNNDLGIISPTAAISSIPYTPNESMAAIRFFYYKLGDKAWKGYGFVDAFNLTNPWFANSFLAIDQGPEIIMIENYRSGMLWNLFMSCPEVNNGLNKLGFQIN